MTFWLVSILIVVIAGVSYLCWGCNHGHTWITGSTNHQSFNTNEKDDRICVRCGKVELNRTLAERRIQQLIAVQTGQPVPAIPGALSVVNERAQSEEK